MIRKHTILLPFQTLMQRRRKRNIGSYIRKVPAALIAFDILLAKNRSLLEKPLVIRRRLLERSVKEGRLTRIMHDGWES